MAQKRAFVGAMLIATGASEFYTQDVEDMDQFNPEVVNEVKEAVAKQSEAPTEETVKEEPLIEGKPTIVQEAEKTFGVPANNCKCGTTGKYHARQCPQYTNPYAKTQAEDLTYQEHLDSIKNE